MREMTERLAEADPELAAAYRAAHEDYLAAPAPQSRTCWRSRASPAGRHAGPGQVPARAGRPLAGRRARASTRSATRRSRCCPSWWRDRAAASERDDADGAERMTTTGVAAIDCGTNSIRLLVADVDPTTGTSTDVDRRMEIVRLGQGVDRTGRLAPEALERTFAACREYAEVVRSSAPSGCASSPPRLAGRREPRRVRRRGA